MSDSKQYNNGKVTFNHRIKHTVNTLVDEKFKEIEDYCDKHRIEKPKKGNFVSDIIESSPVLKMKPEEYMHR